MIRRVIAVTLVLGAALLAGVGVVAQGTPPGAPGSLTYQVSGGTVWLNWISSTGMTPTFDPRSSFYRVKAGGGPGQTFFTWDSASISLHSRYYLHMGGILLAALTALAITHGWWAIYRGANLLARTDNPRRAIGDRYVRRGALLDRHNEPISTTTAQSGELTRQYSYTDLGTIVGYTHPVYGQSGLEASLDDYLRGLRGNPELSDWWNQLLYGQPPPGLDVRLTIDKSIQGIADSLLGDVKGALVLMNAENGEILAIASHPTFNANHLDQDWAEFVDDAGAPLFNRADMESRLSSVKRQQSYPPVVVAPPAPAARPAESRSGRRGPWC